jgi:hypothetical protein
MKESLLSPWFKHVTYRFRWMDDLTMRKKITLSLCTTFAQVTTLLKFTVPMGATTAGGIEAATAGMS